MLRMIMFRYLNGVKFVRIQAAQFFLIGYIRVEAVQVKVLRQIDSLPSGRAGLLRPSGGRFS